MAIESINAAQLIASMSKPEGAVSHNQSIIPFQDYLNESVLQVLNTDAATKTDIVNLVTGNSDALHTIAINTAKADLAIQTLVAVRNKALDAYNEIMRITL